MESIMARALESTLKYWLKSFSRDQFKLQGRIVQLSNIGIETTPNCDLTRWWNYRSSPPSKLIGAKAPSSTYMSESESESKTYVVEEDEQFFGEPEAEDDGIIESIEFEGETVVPDNDPDPPQKFPFMSFLQIYMGHSLLRKA